MGAGEANPPSVGFKVPLWRRQRWWEGGRTAGAKALGQVGRATVPAGSLHSFLSVAQPLPSP